MQQKSIKRVIPVQLYSSEMFSTERNNRYALNLAFKYSKLVT